MGWEQVQEKRRMKKRVEKSNQIWFWRWEHNLLFSGFWHFGVIASNWPECDWRFYWTVLFKTTDVENCVGFYKWWIMHCVQHLDNNWFDRQFKPKRCSNLVKVYISSLKPDLHTFYLMICYNTSKWGTLRERSNWDNILISL